MSWSASADRVGISLFIKLCRKRFRRPASGPFQILSRYDFWKKTFPISVCIIAGLLLSSKNNLPLPHAYYITADISLMLTVASLCLRRTDTYVRGNCYSRVRHIYCTSHISLFVLACFGRVTRSAHLLLGNFSGPDRCLGVLVPTRLVSLSNKIKSIPPEYTTPLLLWP